jgi:cellulose synthase/poly-beta-1,6-N-acetylglucosamine synthase-like glycosyltransferase
MSILWLAVLAAFPVLDSVYRLVLSGCSRLWRRRQRSEWRPDGYLVLIPARGEGDAVEATLESVAAASSEVPVRTLLVLDGEDPVAEEVARRHRVDIVCKTPAGPSKGAVLGWVARVLADDVRASGAVFVLDVGSTLSDGFFDRLRWPSEADGVQAFLSGTGQGPGRTAALSEQFAQRHEDCGREVLGWGVRLRGTGFALKPSAFLAVAGRLVTHVEDIEMSLLLAEGGARAVMGPDDVVVFDEKPERVADAARQRARWLAGQLSLPLRHGLAFVRLVARRPLEGLSFFGEIAGRPLSLTVPLRLAVAAVLAAHAGIGEWSSAEGVVAAIIALTAVFDVLVNVLSAEFRVRSAVFLVASWLRAIVLLPRAFVSWMWTRRQ